MNRSLGLKYISEQLVDGKFTTTYHANLWDRKLGIFNQTEFVPYHQPITVKSYTYVNHSKVYPYAGIKRISLCPL